MMKVLRTITLKMKNVTDLLTTLSDFSKVILQKPFCIPVADYCVVKLLIEYKKRGSGSAAFSF